MRISELAASSGVPAATIKYYVREHLLADGERRSGNQTDYGESHLRRLRLIRALLETGGLTIQTTKRVLATIDDPHAPLAATFEIAQHSLGRTDVSVSPASPEAIARIEALVGRRSWRTGPDNPGHEIAARVLDGFAAIDHVPDDEYLDAYADAASTIATADLTALGTRSDPDAIASLMVVGTVLGDALVAGLRRLVQEDATAELFPYDGPTTTPDGARP